MKLPENFENYFRERWESATLECLLRGLDEEPSVSIRLNPARLPADMLPEGADGRVPWCPEGVYLSDRPAFTADPLLHAGAYYVQEASSMFLAHVLRSLHGELMPLLGAVGPASPAALDLCAAPGGKSTLLRALLPDECLLVANEPVRSRVQVLAENLAKWGHPNVLVTQAHARDFARFTTQHPAFGEGFGLVMADVPCSGEGMFRKEEEALRQWSPAFVAECAALQRSIIADVWPALRPGGTLIYSTCTFNPEEDEENVEWICRELGADLIALPVDPAWGVMGDLRKGQKGMDSLQAGSSSGLMHSPHARPPKEGEVAIAGNSRSSSVIDSAASRAGRAEGEAVAAVEKSVFNHFLPGRVRGEGFFLAVVRKRREVEDAGSPEEAPCRERRPKRSRRGGGPSTLREALAAELPVPSVEPLDAPGVPSAELTLDEAIRYLRREALVLPPDVPKGIVSVCFRGQRLGLVKNLGTRANNLYPREWRIRSTFVNPHTLFPSL